MNNLAHYYTAFWQDYIDDRPIAGGVAYESLLRECQLNKSLSSLREIDLLLSRIRRDINEKNDVDNNLHSAQDKQAYYLNDPAFKKLLMFIGFYMLRVLVRVYKTDLQWLTVDQLERGQLTINAEVPLIPKMAVRFVSQDKQHYLAKTQVATIQYPWLFFVLEPVINRIFATFSYKVNPMQSNYTLTDSVFQAVSQRIPSAIVQGLLQQESSQNVTKAIAHMNKTEAKRSVEAADNNQAINSTVEISKSLQSLTGLLHANTSSCELQNTHYDTQQDTSVVETAQVPQLVATEPQQIQSKNQNIQASPKIKKRESNYAQAWHDLQKITVIQTVAEDVYAKSNQVLSKFDEYIIKKNITSKELSLNDKQTKVLQSALSLLQQAVSLGNTSAMIHLALYQLEGRWLTENKAQAAVHIQSAAERKDMRAMKLLSSLYYRGDAVVQDVDRGEYWCNQAADLGHPEAVEVRKQLLAAQMLVAGRKKDMVSDKRYTQLIIFVLVFALILFFFVPS